MRRTKSMAFFFQDGKTQHNFNKFPEVMLFDCTYKLNDRRMPLAIMLVIDGDGESQAAGLFILKSENSDLMVRMFEEFKAVNPSHERIRVILTDKSAANLNALCVSHKTNIQSRNNFKEAKYCRQ